MKIYKSPVPGYVIWVQDIEHAVHAMHFNSKGGFSNCLSRQKLTLADWDYYMSLTDSSEEEFRKTLNTFFKFNKDLRPHTARMDAQNCHRLSREVLGRWTDEKFLQMVVKPGDFYECGIWKAPFLPAAMTDKPMYTRAVRDFMDGYHELSGKLLETVFEVTEIF